MKFKKLKKELSYTDVIQLWIIYKENKKEEILTFSDKESIPKKYDNMIVGGIGTITGPFHDEQGRYIGRRAIEIVLRKPKKKKKTKFQTITAEEIWQW